MSYTLVTRQGRVLPFYILASAEMFQKILGGRVFGNKQ